MYLEERVEQLETLAVDHGRQIETIAKGVADLTVTVNHRFDRVEKDISDLKSDVSVLKTDVASLKTDVADLKAGQARLETTVQLILTILQERLK